MTAYDGALWLFAVPLLMFAEIRRARRYSLLPGALVRAAVIAAVLGLAKLAPLEYEEQTVPPLGVAEATLPVIDSLHGERTGRTYPRLFTRDSVLATRILKVPSEALPRRDFLAYLGAQLGHEPLVGYEGGFTSVAFGRHPLFIVWRDTITR